MIWFPLAVAFVFPAFAWRGSGTAIKPWLLAALSFAAAAGAMEGPPMVVFLAAMVFPTIVAASMVRSGRVSPVSASAFALSDVALALALSAEVASTHLWTLPAPGAWGPGGSLLALAAALRLGGASRSAEGHAGFTLIGWWQGLLLAAAFGSAGDGLMLGSAVLIWVFFGLRRGVSEIDALAVVGGTVCLAVYLGIVDVRAILAIGLAGSVLSLGHRLAGGWVGLAMPLSLVALSPSSGARGSETALLVALPAAWFLAARAAALTSQFAPPPVVGILPIVSIGATFWALSGTALVWVVVLAGLLVLVTQRASLPAPAPTAAPRSMSPARKIPSGAFWVPLFVALSLWLRLVVTGLSTGFL